MSFTWNVSPFSSYNIQSLQNLEAYSGLAFINVNGGQDISAILLIKFEYHNNGTLFNSPFPVKLNQDEFDFHQAI